MIGMFKIYLNFDLWFDTLLKHSRNWRSTSELELELRNEECATLQKYILARILWGLEEVWNES